MALVPVFLLIEGNVSHVWCDALYVLVGVVEWGLCTSLYTSL